MINLSNEDAKFHYMEKDFERTYTEYFTGEETKIEPQTHYTLKAWEYKILIEQK